MQNDRIFISHYHDPEDGFPNLEEIDGSCTSDDQASTSSVVHKLISRPTESSSAARRVDKKVGPQFSPCCCVLIPSQVVDRLRELGTAVTITPEIRRHLQDVVIFMRLERGVAGGVSPYATVLFESLAKYAVCSEKIESC